MLFRSRGEPGGPTRDSDIFIVNVDDLIAHGEAPVNLTQGLGDTSDDDADWSPSGDKIAFTSRPATCSNAPACQAAAELWVMNADGTNPERLTFNDLEERSPDWSPDGTKILFMCRLTAGTPFEFCVVNPDGTGREVLTNNSVPDLGPGWSPDGSQIVFHRGTSLQEHLVVMDYLADANGSRRETVLLQPPGINLFVQWGTIGVGCMSGCYGCRSASTGVFRSVR